MEVAINQLECHFQKCVNDVDFIERKLRSEFGRHTPADVGDEANVVRLMERISNIKTTVAGLMRDTATINDEKQAMAAFMQQFVQDTAQPLARVCHNAGLELEDGQSQTLNGLGIQNLVGTSTHSGSLASSSSGVPMGTEATPSASAPPTTGRGDDEDLMLTQQDPTGFVEVSTKEFKKVPARLRKGVTLEQLNDAHFIFHEHFVIKKSKKALSSAQIARKNIENVSNVLPCLQALECYRVTPTGSVAMAK